MADLEGDDENKQQDMCYRTLKVRGEGAREEEKMARREEGREGERMGGREEGKEGAAQG